MVAQEHTMKLMIAMISMVSILGGCSWFKFDDSTEPLTPTNIPDPYWGWHVKTNKVTGEVTKTKDLIPAKKPQPFTPLSPALKRF